MVLPAFLAGITLWELVTVTVGSWAILDRVAAIFGSSADAIKSKTVGEAIAAAESKGDYPTANLIAQQAYRYPSSQNTGSITGIVGEIGDMLPLLIMIPLISKMGD